MSLNSVLGTARLALQAQEIAMQTAAHNIANASVDGYTRQVANFKPNLPLYTTQGAIGTGVLVSNVSRVRDQALDVNYRTQSSKASGYGVKRDSLQAISSMFGEPSDTGLSNALDSFWSSWSDLANNPTSTAAKSVVQQRGSQVASTLNGFSTQLDTMAANTSSAIGSQISAVNKYASNIADLNRQIVAAEAGGQTAGDLRDQRDLAIDAISQVVPVTVIEAPSGSSTVYIGGSALVDGVSAKQLSSSVSNGVTSLQVGGTGYKSATPGGALGANLDAVNTDIPGVRQQLDTLAAGIVSTVNSIHKTGWSAAGDALGNGNWSGSSPTGSNVNFFDPTKLTAASMSLSAEVKASAAVIAAGDAQNATGNANVANKLAALRTDTTSIAQFGASGQTTSLNGYFADVVTRVGVSASDAVSSATTYETLTTNAETRRQSLSGVSTDDELVSMTKFQQAYAAAAKVITAASQMSQELIDMVPAA